MNKNPYSTSPLFVGIDGGGSKCRAIVTHDDGRIKGRGLSASANPAHGFEGATKAIIDATLLALKDARLPPTSLSQCQVGAGLAGINLPRYLSQMQQWQHPFKALHLTSDVHIACLGAHQGNDGSVLVIGTGSCGLTLHEGIFTMLGGHGFPYGDQASGAWIGLKVVEAVLLAHDKLVPPTQLTQKVDDNLNLQGDILALRDLMMAMPSRTYAGLAPLAFELYQDDATATQIINDGIDYLNKLAEKLLTCHTENIALIGGLAPLFQPFLSQHIQDRMTPPLSPPEQGAVLFAKQQSC